MITRIPHSLFIIFFLSSIAFGGSTGKITGVVKDKKTGDPIVGANVRLEGTTLGSSTDFDGKYFMLNVPPNEYSLVVTMIGYTSYKITGVRVKGDLTTSIDVDISEAVLQLGQEVEVVAERPLVQKDLTAKTAIVSGEDIVAMPVTEVDQVVNIQAGFVDGSLRGGRSGEVAYWIDGVPVTDAYDGSQIVQVNKNLIQELQVISGAFNAEYGQAMSGIVNITSKEGSSKFSGGLGIYGGDYLHRVLVTYSRRPTRCGMCGVRAWGLALDICGRMFFMVLLQATYFSARSSSKRGAIDWRRHAQRGGSAWREKDNWNFLSSKRIAVLE